MKRLFTLLLGLGALFSAYAAPMDDPIPSASDLTTAGYDVTNNVVLCVRFTEDAKVCNDIYFVGSFSGWSSSFSGCPKFTELASFPGWYAAEAAYVSGFEGKPIQAPDGVGTFSWDYQSGDPDAWAYKGEKKVSLSWSGISGEANVSYGSAGAYVYEISYWKNHATPCIISTATVNVLVPSDCGMDISNGLWLCWWPGDNDYDSHIVKMTAKEGRHFEASFSPNATNYSYYVMNAESSSAAGVRYSNSYWNVYSDTHCVEVLYTTGSYHNLHVHADCAATDHNLIPYNMVATPLNKDTVQFTWEMVDQADAFDIYVYDENDNSTYVGYYSYKPEQGNKFTTGVKVAGNKTFAYWKISLYSKRTENWSMYNVKGNGFTVEGNDAIPSNLVVTDNGDGSYTFNWKCDGAVDHFNIDIENSDTWSTIKSENITAKSYTINLDANVEYYCNVSSFDANNYIGGTYIYFSTKSVAAHDIAAYVHVPQASGISSLDNCYVQWWYPGYAKQTVAMVNEGKNWYRADFKGLTKEYINFKVMNAAKEEDATISWEYDSSISDTTYFILNKNSKGKLGIRYFNKGYYRHDYCAYDIQAKPSAGKVEVSFQTNDAAEYYYIYVYDENGNYVMDRYVYSTDDYENGLPVYVGNKTDGKYYVGVEARGDEGFYGASFVYTDLFDVPASPYLINNLKAADNGDGTYTISWDPIDAPDVDHYYVSIYRPGGYSFYGTSVTEAKLVTRMLPYTGTYTYYVYPRNEENKTMSSAQSTFAIDPVPAHDVTVRVLYHKDCGHLTSDGLVAHFYNYGESKWEDIPAFYEGNNWFNIKYNTTDRTSRVKFSSSSKTFDFYKDTCFQLFPKDTWEFAACDAEPQDHRITVASMKAESKKGRALFYWTAPTKSTEYYIQLKRASGGSTIGTYRTNDTCFQYPVPDSYAGLEITWQVKPVNPYSLDYVAASGTITLQKSEVTISNLQTTTDENDSVNFHMSWECNKENLKYEVYVVGYSSDVWAHDTVATTSFDYTMPVNDQFYWGVYPLDPNDNDERMGPGMWSNYITLTKVPDPFTNFSADVNGKEITFRWDRTRDDIVMRGYLYILENGKYSFIKDTIIDDTEWKYTAEKDAMYVLDANIYIETDPGYYTYLNIFDEVAALVFTGKTYTLTVNCEEGGSITPANLSGQYAEGYKVYFWANAKTGYRFIGWSDGVTDNYRTITMNNDYNITARFEKIPNHTIKVIAGEGGEIKVSGYMDDWGESYEGDFPEESSIYVSCNAKSGYGFYGWSDGYGSAGRYLELVSDSTVTAIFKPLRTVTIGTDANGTANYDGPYWDQTGNVYIVLDGTPGVITATPNTGYRFKEWNDGNAYAVREVVITSDTTFTPSFVEVGTAKKCHVTVSATSGGTATDINADYYEGDKLQLTATPDIGYSFTGWDNGVKDASFELVVSKDTTITAQFEIKMYTLTVKATAGGTVRVGSGDKVESFTEKYKHGESVYIEAYADKHYHFVKWSDGYTYGHYIKVEQDMTITAEFAIDQFLITFLDDDDSFIESKLWDYGSTPSCSVTPTKAETSKYTYEFSGWDPEITAVTKAATYKATYKSTKKEDEGGGGEGGGSGGGEGGGGGGDKPGDQALDNVDASTQAAKIFRDGTIYILRGDKIYTTQGQLVK